MIGPEIRSGIERNLHESGCTISELRVQPDPFTGWRIVVVSPEFSGKSQEERRNIVLKGLRELKIEWLEMFSPQEREWAGNLPLDSDLENLPLWPEALARGALAGDAPKKNVLFPSDLDEDLDLPIVVNFYSLRGGVGRSTSLAYTAKLLASHGRKIVCVDMDLEAPGLAALFGKEKEIEPGQGLVHILLALDQGTKPDITKHLLRVSEEEDLYCLPAGRPDADYARLLRMLDPEAWYSEERNPLHDLLDQLANNLPFKPDVILLDSRTGISQLSAPLLFDLSDLTVIVFFPHPQSLTGTSALVRALLSAQTRRSQGDKALTPEPRFIVSPIPASKLPEIVKRYNNLAIGWITDWLSPLSEHRQADAGFDPSEISHFIPYRESIATSDQILSERDAWRDYEPVADWIERFLPTGGEETLSQSRPDIKNNVLRELRFSIGSAEQQADFFATFVETELVTKAIDSKVPLVLGRKGTGKTALFRRLAEDTQKSAVVVTAPAPLRGGRDWLLGIDGFKSVSDILAKNSADWRQFWTIYTCLANHFSWKSENGSIPQPDGVFAEVLNGKSASEMTIVRLIETLTSTPNFGLLANDWLTRLDKAVNNDTILLFDGLDTGFGITDADRKRRRAALEGLFVFVTDRGDNLKNLRFKIVLREDIWRTLKFDNKSHFFGRSVVLKWSDQVSFIKVALKQALRHDSFKFLVSAKLRSDLTSDIKVGLWGQKEVFTAWNLLVGERMKGANTTFTRNWVWNRLADSNDDHSPRYLLQLMYQATEWEREEQKRTAYDKSIIRPRGLIEVLQKVSGEALGALRDEEFPELKDLMDKLIQIGRTPLDAYELDSLSQDSINLAREVGLLGVYEGSDENVERYKVPEIFRHALNMTRKGQA